MQVRHRVASVEPFGLKCVLHNVNTNYDARKDSYTFALAVIESISKEFYCAKRIQVYEYASPQVSSWQRHAKNNRKPEVKTTSKNLLEALQGSGNSTG